MVKNENSTQLMIARYSQQFKSGIQSVTLTKHCIGYVSKGHKYIYSGDVRSEVKAGDIFYLNIGNHYIEDVPESGKSFEQTTFYYTTEMVGRVLTHLSVSYQFNVDNDHSCESCRNPNFVAEVADPVLKNFFNNINQYIKCDIFDSDPTSEQLMLTEMIYLILTQSNLCIKSKVLDNADVLKENFEQVILNNIFNDVSVEQLASLCNRSLTSFKKEFKRHFCEPPHKWFIKQRLMHSRLLLISTNKSISEVGIDCSFPNTSHFIKLFKKEYNLTPATYRHIHSKTPARSAMDQLSI